MDLEKNIKRSLAVEGFSFFCVFFVPPNIFFFGFLRAKSFSRL